MSPAACWEDRGNCELWAGKLRGGQEAGVAVKELGDNGCVPYRALLLEHFEDPGLTADVLAALVTLGRSPEAEAAVTRGLGRPETAVAAADQVAKWKLVAAEPELRAALADAAQAGHKRELLTAALAVAPAARWLDAIAIGLTAGRGDVDAQDQTLAALAQVVWADAAPEARAPVVTALAELLSRPPGAVPVERVQAAARELARIPRLDPPPALADLRTRALEGNRSALLILWSLGHPAALEAATALASSAGIDPAVRAAALAILASAPPAELAAQVAAAPADAAVLEGLALLGGPAVAPALAARLEADKGAARAALARAQALALPAAELPAWAAALAKQASLLMRNIPVDPVVAATVALTEDCRGEAACYARILGEAVPTLATLDVDLTAARAAQEAAATQAQADVAADAERAAALAEARGDALEAAKTELDAIQARRDAAWASAAEAQKRVDQLLAASAVAAVALRRIMLSDPANSAEYAVLVRSVLEKCRGAACAPTRAWAVAAWRWTRQASAAEVATVVAANADDPALACVIAALAGAGR